MRDQLLVLMWITVTVKDKKISDNMMDDNVKMKEQKVMVTSCDSHNDIGAKV